jgi:hypothetical protein
LSAASPLLDAFDRQVLWCQPVAPFTALVLQRTRLWLQRDAHAHAVLTAAAMGSSQQADPLSAAIPLRWAAALHHLALQGVAPFASLWPSTASGLGVAAAGAAASSPQLKAAIGRALQVAWLKHRPHLDRALAHPPQTNEVQRSAALLPALLHVAAQTKLPLALLELGASAGLNLWCDRYRYAHGVWQWGDAAAPLVLRSEWLGPKPEVSSEASTDLRVVYRAGCDLHPVDLSRPDEALRLASFVWADQAERLQRLRSAAAAVGPWLQAAGNPVVARPASAFLKAELAQPRLETTTVLMHSVVWQYLGDEEQRLIFTQVESAGQRATASAPLAWVRFEPPAADGHVELRCRIWPGRHDRLLARCHPHGSRIEWLADA